MNPYVHTKILYFQVHPVFPGIAGQKGENGYSGLPGPKGEAGQRIRIKHNSFYAE